MFQECTECLNRYFGAFNRTQLLTYVRDNNLRPQIALQRVLLRGTKDIPKTLEFVQELKKAGASPQLIDLVVPADEIPLPTPAGYKPEVLVHELGYERRLTTGFLHVIVKVAGQMDFIFQDSALFTKVVQGTDKSGQSKVLKGTITTPLPRNIAPPNFEVYSVFPQKKKKTDPPDIKSENGRIEFTVKDADKEPHIYEIKIKFYLC